MTDTTHAESATAPEVGDISVEEAFCLLKIADPDGKFGYTINTDETRWQPKFNSTPTQRFGVIVTGDGEQHAAQQMLTLRAAVEEVIQKINQPASVKASALRAEAAAILARAEQLESTSK